MNGARASLDELLLDYEDFLRQRSKRLWKKDDPEAREVRAVGRRSDRMDPADPSGHWKIYSGWLDATEPAVVANTVLCLIHQANYLLDQQIAVLEREFIHEGGYTEQLAAARLEERRKQERSRSDRPDRRDPTDPVESVPTCPACSKAMILRTARQGRQSGSQFWVARVILSSEERESWDQWDQTHRKLENHEHSRLALEENPPRRQVWVYIRRMVACESEPEKHDRRRIVVSHKSKGGKHEFVAPI